MKTVNPVRPFVWIQLAPLILPQTAIDETSFVDNLVDFAPSVPWKAAFPRRAETLDLERPSKPSLNLLQSVIKGRVAFRCIRTRARRSCKRRAGLVLATTNIGRARHKRRHINPRGWWLDDSRLRTFSLWSAHGMPARVDPLRTIANKHSSLTPHPFNSPERRAACPPCMAGIFDCMAAKPASDTLNGGPSEPEYRRWQGFDGKVRNRTAAVDNGTADRLESPETSPTG